MEDDAPDLDAAIDVDVGCTAEMGAPPTWAAAAGGAGVPTRDTPRVACVELTPGAPSDGLPWPATLLCCDEPGVMAAPFASAAADEGARRSSCLFSAPSVNLGSVGSSVGAGGRFSGPSAAWADDLLRMRSATIEWCFSATVESVCASEPAPYPAACSVPWSRERERSSEANSGSGSIDGPALEPFEVGAGAEDVICDEGDGGGGVVGRTSAARVLLTRRGRGCDGYDPKLTRTSSVAKVRCVVR